MASASTLRRQDRIVDEQTILAIRAALPGPAYHVLDGVGHAPYLEDPDAYGALIADHAGLTG